MASDAEQPFSTPQLPAGWQAPGPEAEAAFSDFVEEVDGGAEPDIEAYCARHPELADELRWLHDNWLRVDLLLSELAEEAAQVGVDDIARRHAQEMLARLQGRMPRTARYRVDHQVARGGMGSILLVHDDDLRRRLAMKKLLDHDSAAGSNLTLVSRFVEEAQITGQLEHPGIVPVHDLGIDETGNLYFTMRLVKGRNLARVIESAAESAAGWNRARLLSVVLKVCEAMAFAHSKGVVHCDLKPGNVMVGSFGETYVMDWGLARVLEANSPLRAAAEQAGVATDGVVLDPPSDVNTTRRDLEAGGRESGGRARSRSDAVDGTPSYMAPEQARGEFARVGPRADVYSVGAILYHLLSGRVPYVAAGEPVDRAELLARVRAGPPEPLEHLTGDVPPELIAICEKAMARHPEQRYPGMISLAEDLRAFQEQRVVRALETGAWAEFRKWVARNRWTAAALGLALLATITALAVYSALLSRDRDELLLLSDLRQLALLEQRAERFWPAEPARIEAMEQWLIEAEAFTSRRAEHTAALELLRVHGRPAGQDSAGALTPLEREELRNSVAVVAQQDELAAFVQAVPEPELREKLRAKFTGELEGAAVRLAELERVARTGLERWEFASEEWQWQHDSHALVVAAMDALHDPDPHRGAIARVTAQLELARGLLAARSRHAEKWAEAAAAISDAEYAPQYEGLVLAPQLGLLPLGPDPDSHLWEFAHLPSGEPPRRDEDGRLVIGPRSSIVLVLLPGGSFRMGAESAARDDPAAADGLDNLDSSARYGEQPVHEVELAPFFLSKYELTQAQWQRATGENPSYYFSGFTLDDFDAPEVASWVHPVEQVDWFECGEVLAGLGLTLPTEAQWEYGIRAGTSTRYWSGVDVSSLAGGANLEDAEPEPGSAGWFDGFHIPVAVDSLRPNAFGLHHMTGNVWEWCRDGFNTSYAWEARAGDGLRRVPELRLRVVRGGSYSSSPSTARSAFRNDDRPDRKNRGLGVRAARSIESE